MNAELLSLAESVEDQPNATPVYFSLALIFFVSANWHWFRGNGIFIVLAAFLSAVSLTAAVVSLLR
jgi:hypothetical protein